VSGSWFQAKLFGNPLPSIYDRPVFSPGPSTLQVTATVPFTFSSVDYSSNNGDSAYLIQGFQGTVNVFNEIGTLNGTFSFAFSTLFSTHPSVQVTSLLIQLTPGDGVSSINLDNISASSSVPEPGGRFLVGLVAGAVAAYKYVRGYMMAKS